MQSTKDMWQLLKLKIFLAHFQLSRLPLQTPPNISSKLGPSPPENILNAVKAFWSYVSAKKTVDGSRCRGRLRKSWHDNINEWQGQSLSSLLHITDDRSQWATNVVEASVTVQLKDIGRDIS